MNKREAKIISDKVVSALIERQKAVCMTNYQIAKKTGLPQGTVKSRLFNARKILSEKLKPLKENTDE